MLAGKKSPNVLADNSIECFLGKKSMIVLDIAIGDEKTGVTVYNKENDR